MKTIFSAVFFFFLPFLVTAAELSYLGEPLKKDPLEDGQSLYPGTFDAPLAGGNGISVDYVPDEKSTDPDSVYAGFARTGTSEGNRLTFKNGHVPQFVFGGFSLKGDVKGNIVVFSGGTVADAAVGKLCGGQTKDGDVRANAVMITGGKVVGDVYGGDADADGHADGNRIEIANGEMSGFVNGGGVSGIGIARNNRVTVSGGKIGMGVSAGFAHFAAGSASETDHDGEKTNSVLDNAVEISGKTEIEGNVSGGFILDSTGSAKRNSVKISGGTIRGNVYGGRAFRGDAIGNVVTISGGTISGRNGSAEVYVYAGYVHKPDKSNPGRATGNTVTVSGSPGLKSVVFYGSNLPTWRTDGNTLNFRGFRGTVYGLSRFQRVHVDKDSDVTVIGEGPHEIVDLDNEGRIVFQRGQPLISR